MCSEGNPGIEKALSVHGRIEDIYGEPETDCGIL